MRKLFSLVALVVFLGVAVLAGCQSAPEPSKEAPAANSTNSTTTSFLQIPATNSTDGC